MKNFIVRTITGVFFVAAIVVSFLNPMAMVFLFALVTGLTIWEFCGLVNERPYVQVNQFISTVAGVYLFLAMAGHCSGSAFLDAERVGIPPGRQLFVCVAPERVCIPLDERYGCLPLWLVAGSS